MNLFQFLYFLLYVLAIKNNLQAVDYIMCKSVRVQCARR